MSGHTIFFKPSSNKTYSSKTLLALLQFCIQYAFGGKLVLYWIILEHFLY